MAMRNVNIQQLESFEDWTAMAFLLGGGIFAAVVVSLVVLGDAASDRWIELALVAVFALVTVGLAGLHPTVRRHEVRSAAIGIAGALLAGGGALLALVVIAAVAVIGWNPGIIEVVVWMGTLAGLALGSLAFGISIWRTPAVKRVIGGLLVVGGVSLLVYITNTLLWELEVVALLMMVIWGITLLGIGAVLRTQPLRPAERLEDQVA